MLTTRTAAHKPLHVYGSCISYYTGKLEAYLRYKEIEYDFVPMTPAVRRRIIRETGAAQMPAVELPDGRFMTDTTPMIAWFEDQYPDPAVLPPQPLLSFVSRLVEDYAEEWLWRPAMHYRWSYAPDREKLGRIIADEVMENIPLPGVLKRALIRRRQHHFWVRRDGVDATTWDHVESIYLRALDHLEAILSKRPFLLGGRPSLADFGFFASMFRHFAQDPTPSQIMQQRAPAVYAWQARLWNARASDCPGELLGAVPEDWSPLLDQIGAVYLPYLNDNARAYAQGLRRFDASVESVPYRQLPVSRYRVWCLQRLRTNFAALDAATQADARRLLEKHDAWSSLWETDVDAHYDDEHVPFRGIKVHYTNRFP